MNHGKAKLLVFGFVIAATLVACLYANRGYGEVSDVGYQYATALYSACNQSDAAKLEKLSGMISASREQQEIDDRESRWLTDIIERGRRGDWHEAAGEARKLLEDQVHGA